jgi:serine protease Do
MVGIGNALSRIRGVDMIVVHLKSRGCTRSKTNMKKLILRMICVAALSGLQLSGASLYAAPTLNPVASPSAATLEQETIDAAPKCVACTVGLVAVMDRGIASGSGVLVSADGLILTAGHVIEKPGTKLTVRFTDGRVVQGVAVGLDHATDTGLAKIIDPAPPGGWDFCPMAPAQSAAIGDWVLCTGNPGSIVVDRNPPLRLGRVTGHDRGAIDTNCALEPGDSGGPLFDLSGRVVGINSRIMTSSGNNHPDEYLSLHVPISMFIAQWKDLLAGINANPDVSLDGRAPARPKQVPGIGTRARAALNKLADEKDPEAIKLLADELKTGTLKPTPAQMERLLKLAAQMDRDGKMPTTAPSAIPPKVAGAGPTTAPSAKPEPMPEMANSGPFENGGPPNSRASLAVGKTSLRTLSLFAPATENAGDCLVEIIDGNQVVLQGTIIDSNGWIVTKASDLPANPRVMLPDGRLVHPKVVGKDAETDLALLKVPATGLTAVQFTRATQLGEWLAAPTANPNQPAMGVVSLAPRMIPETFSHFEGEQRIVLGVGFGRGADETIIQQVTKGMPAEAAGIKIGDDVFEINGVAVHDHDSFVTELKKAKAGDTVSIKLHRKGEVIEVKPVIGEAKATTQTASSIGEADNVAGGKLSKRRTNFPKAIQTDAAIWADQCGGPLLNLQGQTVGITIARYDRVCTFALPAELVQSTVEKLKAKQ